jgi:hypothetical protein
VGRHCLGQPGDASLTFVIKVTKVTSASN